VVLCWRRIDDGVEDAARWSESGMSYQVANDASRTVKSESGARLFIVD